jgi:DNA-binding CsgD family transcriptional regulator
VAANLKQEKIFSFTDACYALDGSDEEWLSRLASEGRPFLDYGMGVAAWAFRKDDWTGFELPRGVDATLGTAMWDAAKNYSGPELVQLFMGGRATSATERLAITQGLDEHHAGSTFGPLGVKDFHALTVWDGSGSGVALAGASGRVLRATPQQLARLERLGAHVLAGYRLRRALRKVDAVLAPDGRPLHAEGEAREPSNRDALSRAVRAFDHARSQRAGDADESLNAFEGLVAGQWSIVQSFESDGRRYLVAIQNQPGQMAAAALTGNEAHALLLRAQGLAYKLVCYELGLSESATHHLVQQGMRKLGIGRETDLALIFRQQASAELEKARNDG